MYGEKRNACRLLPQGNRPRFYSILMELGEIGWGILRTGLIWLRI
jgi:hypothetical protein